MKQTNPEESVAFGTEIMQPRTVAQILYTLPELGLIDMSLKPDLVIIFFDDHIEDNENAVHFHCVTDIDRWIAPVYAEVIKNSTDRPFSKTCITYGDVLEMKCKSVDCVYVGDLSRNLHKYNIRIEVPGLYAKVKAAEEKNRNDLFGFGHTETECL